MEDVSQGEQQSTSEKLKTLGVEMSTRQPQNGPYDGYISLSGTSQSLLTNMFGFVDTSGVYGQGPRRLGVRKELERIFQRKDGTIDLLIPSQNGHEQMVRLITQKNQDDSMRISLGGGGNLTRFEDMEHTFSTTVDQLVPQNTS